ncbi:MAG: hypothetical protein IPO88_20255 [Nannocystis sp.]|uniref:hypothetical protein n=1 Tax=Nannocystis sp. TaxID=1962667 RepID=UPI0024272F5D|nr:hypothetical protein [Nannocystis sp.]MBK9755794.1 hypothetical protein [Nannocystis sp.]
MPDDEFGNNLALLDRGMDDLRCRPIDLGRVASKAANTPVVCREDPLDEQLYRSSLRALLLTGSVKDLPESDRSRPEVQTRLDAHAAEVDFAVHGMSHRLAHMPPEELARIQDRLRRDPDLAQRIIEYIDDEAHKSDFPLGRRLRLRRLARIALWRLRHQPVEMVVHECTDKVRRLSDRLTPLARETPFARPRPEDVAYWEAQTLRVVERYQDTTPPAVDPSTGDDTRTMEPPAAATPPGELPPSEVRPPPAESETAEGAAPETRVERRRRLLRIGGIVLGVGLGLLVLGLGLALGGAAAATGGPLAGVGFAIGGGVLATAAAITLIVGIVLMVMGSASKS